MIDIMPFLRVFFMMMTRLLAGPEALAVAGLATNRVWMTRQYRSRGGVDPSRERCSQFIEKATTGLRVRHEGPGTGSRPMSPNVPRRCRHGWTPKDPCDPVDYHR